MPPKAATHRTKPQFQETDNEIVEKGLDAVHRLRRREETPRHDRKKATDFLCETFGICYGEIQPLLHERVADDHVRAYLERKLRERREEENEELEGRKAS